MKGFVVLPRRWVVERTFSWFGRNWRLAKDFENLAETLATFVTLASTCIAWSGGLKLIVRRTQADGAGIVRRNSSLEGSGFEPSVPRDRIKTSRGLVSALLDSPPNVSVSERETGAPRRRLPPVWIPARSGPHRQSSRRRTHAPVRMSRRVGVPEHDLVEIDRLGLRAPVAVDAEARLCVDEGRAVAAGAIVADRPSVPGRCRTNEPLSQMSTRPLASWAGLRRTCTVVQLSRGRSRRQICARITIGGWAQGEPARPPAQRSARAHRAAAPRS